VAGRRSAQQARDSREAILERATHIASVEGLEGITIGRLASDVGMSKAGVLGHFGSKEELQLEVLDRAAEIFRESVWRPAEHAKPGLERLLAICDAWVEYARNPPFEGGCFIAAASFEYDSRDGRVHDDLRRVVGRWRKVLVAEVETAIEASEMPAGTDAEQVAFTLEALAAAINPARYLQGDGDATAQCLRAMHQALGVGELAARI
jgi:AcrR family transcriptional regulator